MSIKPNLIVHVGAAKTGSSAIQGLLKKQDKALKAAGMWNLGRELNTTQGEVCHQWQTPGRSGDLLRADPEELLKLMLLELNKAQQSGLTNIIWSNEGVFNKAEIFGEIFRKIREAGFPVKVVAYIRRPDAWARSAYYQWGVKDKNYRGEVKPFKAWLAEKPPVFSKRIELWIALLGGDFYLRNYEARSDVANDFIKFIGMTPIEEYREYDRPNSALLSAWIEHNSLHDDKTSPRKFLGVLRDYGVHDVDKFFASEQRDFFVDAQGLSWAAERLAKEVQKINEFLTSAGETAIDTSIPLSPIDGPDQWSVNKLLLRLIFAVIDRQQTQALSASQEKIKSIRVESGGSDWMNLKKSEFPFARSFFKLIGDVSIRGVDDLEILLARISEGEEFQAQMEKRFDLGTSGAYYWYAFLDGFLQYSRTGARVESENSYYLYLCELFERKNFDPNLRVEFENKDLIIDRIGRRFATLSAMIEDQDLVPAAVKIEGLGQPGSRNLIYSMSGRARMQCRRIDGFHRIFCGMLLKREQLFFNFS